MRHTGGVDIADVQHLQRDEASRGLGGGHLVPGKIRYPRDVELVVANFQALDIKQHPVTAVLYNHIHHVGPVDRVVACIARCVRVQCLIKAYGDFCVLILSYQCAVGQQGWRNRLSSDRQLDLVGCDVVVGIVNA